MEITRKSFISGAAIAVAGLSLLSSSAGAAALEELEEDAHVLRRAVGEVFYARGEGGVLVPLGLERSVDVRSDAVSEQYRLYFSAGDEYALAEGTWRLVSSNGRRVHDVFLARAGSNASGDRLYRADFCLLKSARRPSAR